MAAYNASQPKGPNPLTTDVNSLYPDMSSNVFIMVASASVWPIMPGIALLYAGLARRQSAMSLLFQIFMVWGAVGVIWFLMGYSLVTTTNGGPFIGTLDNGGLRYVEASPSPGTSAISEVVYMLFQCYFCVATVAIMIGGSCERGRMIPSIIFSCIWSIVVYDFTAYWSWNANGWLYKLGTLDFAGGSPVHIASGFGALGYAFVLGKRRDSMGQKTVISTKPHNPVLVFIGTTLITFGWHFFNAGTALNSSVRAAYAMANTSFAASGGILSYTILGYLRNGHRWSVVGSCAGAISGLVGITPAAGYVPLHFGLITGIVTGIVCNLTESLVAKLGIDEGLEVFNLHGIGGFCGGICTAIFAADWVAALDGATVIDGGWINGNFVQLGYNLAGCVTIAAWSFVVTVVILKVMDFIPGLQLRVSEEIELGGFDNGIMEEQMESFVESFTGRDKSTPLTTDSSDRVASKGE